jgi:hypothetical protein
VSRRREIAIAGHTGQVDIARAALADPDPSVRATALGALQRLGHLTVADVATMLDPAAEPSADVRRRAAQAAASMPDCALRSALDDSDWSVVEMSCWAIGEHESADDATLQRLIELAGSHPEPLVREAAVAALGAVGDPRGMPAIIAATHDKPAVRRRAAVALAPFDSPEADDALRALLDDRDWQTRQIAEDLLDERPG